MKYGESVVVEMEPDLELAEQAVSAGDITSSRALIAATEHTRLMINSDCTQSDSEHIMRFDVDNETDKISGQTKSPI